MLFIYEELETLKKALENYDKIIDKELENSRNLEQLKESLNISSLINRIEKELKKGK